MSDEIMKLCVDVGGSLSGEHGIGYEKKDFMGMVFSESDIDAMMRVKDRLQSRRLAESLQNLSDPPLLHGDRKVNDHEHG